MSKDAVHFQIVLRRRHHFDSTTMALCDCCAEADGANIGFCCSESLLHSRCFGQIRVEFTAQTLSTEELKVDKNAQIIQGFLNIRSGLVSL